MISLSSVHPHPTTFTILVRYSKFYLQILFSLNLQNVSLPRLQWSFIVSGDDVSVDPEKNESIQTWPELKTLRELRVFLGLTDYHCLFVAHFAALAAPLTQLLRKEAFVWSQEATGAFAQLRKAMSSTLVLALPNFSIPFIIQTNASGNGVGAIFAQNGWPIAFFSKQLTPRVQSTSAYNRELCALVLAIQNSAYNHKPTIRTVAHIHVFLYHELC